MVIIDEIHKCLDYDTIIKTSKGDLKIGDIVTNNIDCNVISYNENLNKFQWQPIINKFEINNTKKLVKVETKTKSLKCTEDHKIYTINRGWVEAKDLSNNDEVIINNSDLLNYKKEKITEISYITEKINKVYDIEVYKNHNYIANNILVHNCKNPESAQGLGLLSLDPSIEKMGMTGTLLVNSPIDLYAPMKLIGLINMNRWKYENEYTIKDDWKQIVGYKNMDQLHEILYKSSIRRTKDLLNLPEKVYKQEWLEFTQKEELDVWNQVIGVKKPFSLEKIEPIRTMLSAIVRMRQATISGEVLTSNCKTSTKFNRLNDILEEAKLNNQKVLVFCPFTEILELGLNYCKEYKPKLVKGGMGSKLQEVLDEHENTEGFSVIFAQEATIGVGFTLINTSIVVFLSPPWNRANYDQLVDRCFAKNTIVMTLDGPKYIQNITTRDYVFTPYGNIKRVTATHIIKDNQKQMAKIEIKGLGTSYEIKCTSDHKILSKEGKWKPVKDFNIGDYVYIIPEIDDTYGEEKIINLDEFIEASNRSKNSNGKVKNYNESFLYNSKLKVDKELMFLIGMYLGDGFVQKDYKFFSICGNDTTKLDSLLKIQKYILSIAHCSSYICKGNGHGRELRNNIEPLARFLELNFGRIREQKFIPKWIFNLKKSYLESLLEGLMRSDGYIQYKDNNTKQGQFITTTPSIATSIWFLLYRLGYKARFYTVYHNEKDHKREWRIEYNKLKDDNIRADHDNKVGRITDLKFYSIKNHKNTKLYDISVEDDECYMVGNLPVHNCHRIGQKRTVQVIDLYMANTYDELINKKLWGKGALADRLIDGKEDEAVLKYLKEAGIVYNKDNTEHKVENELLTLLDGLF